MCSVNAQESFQFGALPAFNFNKKFEKGWVLNTRLESRQIFKEGTFSQENNFNYQWELTDLIILGAKKITPSTTVAGGYLIRNREGAWFYRAIQQMVYVWQPTGIRWAYRFSTDQTFTQNETPEFRFRNRITLEKSLNGALVDVREFYFKFNNEYLFSLQNSETQLEMRLVPLLGYEYNKNNKIEAGLDYRVSSVLDKIDDHRFFIAISWFYTL